MYLKYFDFREAPFGITPDPAFLYSSESHREVIASVLYAVRQRKGFVSIIGEVGSGKTTILRSLINRFYTDRVKALYLFNPEISFNELMRVIFQELDLPLPDGDINLAIQELHRYLIEVYRRGECIILMIDEAQRMPVETLEHLRILSNIETSKHKLLQIVLCGQPEFEELLARHQLRQLRQRISIRSNIEPLSTQECQAYIQHRIAIVSQGKPVIFSPAALRQIISFSKGNPRMINIVCENCLIAGFAKREKPIKAATVREVIHDLKPRHHKPFVRWMRAAAFLISMIIVSAIVLFTYYSYFLFHSNNKVLASQNADEKTRVYSNDLTKINTVIADTEEQNSFPCLSNPSELKKEETESAIYSYSFMDLFPSAYPYEKLFTNPKESGLIYSEETGDTEFSCMVIQTEKRNEDKLISPNKVVESPDEAPINNDMQVSVDKKEMVVLTVKPGDTLARLVRRVYGYDDMNLLKHIMLNNPQIHDMNVILSGDKLVFPPIDFSEESWVQNHTPRQEISCSD